MLDSTTVNRFNYNINAVSGTLRKSHPKSRIAIRGLLDNLMMKNLDYSNMIIQKS